jgi:hypothetical protein
MTNLDCGLLGSHHVAWHAVTNTVEEHNWVCLHGNIPEDVETGSSTTQDHQTAQWHNPADPNLTQVEVTYQSSSLDGKRRKSKDQPEDKKM